MNKSNPNSQIRPTVEGKFIVVGKKKFYIKGTTYGTFAPDENGSQFPSTQLIEKDFALMTQHGVNAVRTYTVPPLHLLEIADAFGLKVMVGLPWEQHITFLDSKKRMNEIIRRTQEGVEACGKHPAILCYTIGNEIPAPMVRWYGKKKIENFLNKLYKAVKQVDPEGLCTYVNYPTTEYLQLPFLDFDCFNVYLETQEKLDSYLARLHNLCGDRPMVLAEIGLDSQRNGMQQQAETLEWQISTIFARGCAGAFVFAWTDEWWRGGFDIEDWDFGLVSRGRQPKPALYTVSNVFKQAPFATKEQLPRISVVVCSYNGSSTIQDTMEGLLALDYPDYEVIVINDGSTDSTPEIVSKYPFQLISTPNQGLSNARNTGMQVATGEIVAYIDDDAYPDPHWLKYLAYAYQNSDHAGVGGPNLLPKEDGPIADCVFNAPGGPVHVLITDELAEHIPGCNMSFRRDALIEVEGFDPIYRAAGDDVDLCWRMQKAGYTIGFHPSAMVWHHRRNSLKAYWKQQKGYGKAEALLAQKWPERYNEFGHVSWTGRIYGAGLTQPLKLKKDQVFHGTWGSALFQSVYQQSPHFASSIPLMPEWYFLIAFLGLLSLVGLSWTPLLFAIPLFILSILVVLVQAGMSAAKASFVNKPDTAFRKFKYWALTTVLHAVQPIARLYGRIKHGLTPWRKAHSTKDFALALFSWSNTKTHWSEDWRSMEDWLSEIEANLTGSGARSCKGGHFDRWDLQANSSLFSSARGLLTIEEHGSNKQYLKFRYWPHFSRVGLAVTALSVALTSWAIADQALIAAALLGFITLSITFKYLSDTTGAVVLLANAFEALEEVEETKVPAEEEQQEPIHAIEGPLRVAEKEEGVFQHALKWARNHHSKE